MKEVKITNDLLRNELRDYYDFLKQQLGVISSLDDLINLELEDIEIMDDEVLYDTLLDYINVNTSYDFNVEVNKSKETSIQLKLLLVMQLYEYVNSNYNYALIDEKEVYDQLCINPSTKRALQLFEKYSSTILNLYCTLILDNYNYQKIIECRVNIIKNNRLDEVLEICPYSLFDYRFFLGYKCFNEEINSVFLGKQIISMVIQAKERYQGYDPQILKDNIHLVVEDNPKLSSIIEANQSFIIANVYEHLLTKSKLDNNEQYYIDILEKKGIDELFQLLFKKDDSLEFLIYLFYQLNSDCFDEKRLYELRKNTKRKGKVKVIEKINPLFYEEDSYFNNWNN